MNVDPVLFLGVAAALLALAAAGLAFWRTPPGERMRPTTTGRERDLQRKRARVQRGELVEIAPQRARAARMLAWWVLPLSPGLGLVLASRLGVDLSCTPVPGGNLSLWMLLWTLWVLPVVLVAASLALARQAWRGLQQGCFPPADSVVLIRTWGDRTWVGKLRALIGLVLPPLALWALVLSVQLHQSLLAGRPLSGVASQLARDCGTGLPP